jgi:hypothetical protein
LLVPALIGSAAVELLGVVPAGWQLFTHVKQVPTLLRLALVGLTGLLFCVSLVVSAVFVLWGQLQLLQSPTTINQDQLALYIVAAFGLLLAFVSTMAFYALLVGMGALVSVFVGAVWCLLRLLHVALALLGDTIANTSLVDRSSYGQPAYTTSHAASHRERELPPDDVPPSETESEEFTPMTSVHRNVTVLACGSVSSRLGSFCLDYVKEAGANGVLHGFGVIDPSHTYRKETLPSVPGVHNYTLPLQVIQTAYTDVLEPGMTNLANAVKEQVIERCAQHQGGILIVVVDLPLLADVANALDELHTRARQEIVLLCPFSRVDVMHKEHREEGISILRRLHATGTVGASLVIDATSSTMAAKVDSMAIETAAVQTLLSLCIAGYSDESNPTLAEVLAQLGSHSPCMGFAFTTVQTVSGKQPIIWHVARAAKPSVGARGSGSMPDILIQATNSIKSVMTDNAYTASLQPLDAQKPSFVLCHLPYARGDKRFAETATALTRFLKATYPNTQGIMVHGNGVALPTVQSTYRVGVTVLYPLMLPTPNLPEKLALEEMQIDNASAEAVSLKQNGRRRHEAIEK